MPTARSIAVVGVLSSLAVCAALSPTAALGADSIYWADPTIGKSKILLANLDGTNPVTLATTGVTLAKPSGSAIDSVSGRIYWTDLLRDKISFANLDGSGGDDLEIEGTAISSPQGLAIDPVARRIYWANTGDGTIKFADLDGRNGGEVNTDGATGPVEPVGVTIDPTARRIYWGDLDTIGFANLDGSGGGDVVTGKATVAEAFGVAIDPTAGRIYWANLAANRISFANLDGSGGEDLDTGAGTVLSPTGLAIDPTAGRIYWANTGPSRIAFANLDDSGTGGVLVNGTADDDSAFPVLLLSPRPEATPAIAGAANVGSVLSCSEGAWASDLIESLLYRAPQSFAFQWSRNGDDIAGADQSTLTADSTGDYRCRVTAQNHAGAATQTSGPHAVAPASEPRPTTPGPGDPGPSDPGPGPLAAFGSATRVKLTLATNRISRRGRIAIRIANANAFAITGTLTGRTARPIATAHKRRIALKATTFDLAANAKRTVELTLPKALRRLLAHRHKLSLALALTVTDPAGNHRTVKKTVKLRRRQLAG